MTELKENADDETYELFVDKILFYNNFQKIRHILQTIKTWTSEEANTFWSVYGNGKEFLVDLNADIEKIKFCDFKTLEN